MTDSMRDLIRDELAGWHIGSSYYLTTISVDEARDMADAVLAVLAEPVRNLVKELLSIEEKHRRYLVRSGLEPSHDACGNCGDGFCGVEEELEAAFRAAFGGEQSDD